MKIERVSSKIWGAAISVLVVLALITAEFTWLAQPVHAEAGWPSYNWARLWLNSRIVGYRVQVAGSGFPRQHILLVRARLRDGSPWYNLATLKASQRGRFFADLPLPHHLENANNLRVCVKDTLSSRLTCATARRY
jgi:hypothetical protein